MLNQRSSNAVFHILGELDRERKHFFKCKTFTQSTDNALSRAL